MKLDLSKVKLNLQQRPADSKLTDIKPANPTADEQAPAMPMPIPKVNSLLIKRTPALQAAVTEQAKEQKHTARIENQTNQIASQSAGALAVDLASRMATRALPEINPKLSDDENYLAQMEASQLHERIVELQTALLTEHPRMPGLMNEIHKTLLQQPDNVTLIEDDEIGVIFAALSKQANIVVAVKTATGKKGGKKPAGGFQLSDL